MWVLLFDLVVGGGLWGVLFGYLWGGDGCGLVCLVVVSFLGGYYFLFRWGLGMRGS